MTSTVLTVNWKMLISISAQVQYFHEHEAFSMPIALNQSPAVYLSATIGSPSIAFSMQAKHNTTSGCFSQYKAGIGMTGPDCNASIVL